MQKESYNISYTRVETTYTVSSLHENIIGNVTHEFRVQCSVLVKFVTYVTNVFGHPVFLLSVTRNICYSVHCLHFTRNYMI